MDTWPLTVVQAMLSTDYDWWATRGTRYQHERDLAAGHVLACLDRYLPGMQSSVEMTDIATPLTFWRSARSWRGAYEGWMPTPSTFKHVSKQLAGLERFYMAGQWVEPGGGVPMAIMSGRHVAEILCAAFDRRFGGWRAAGATFHRRLTRSLPMQFCKHRASGSDGSPDHRTARSLAHERTAHRPSRTRRNTPRAEAFGSRFARPT
jgi:hypothetical protein